MISCLLVSCEQDPACKHCRACGMPSYGYHRAECGFASDEDKLYWENYPLEQGSA